MQELQLIVGAGGENDPPKALTAIPFGMQSSLYRRFKCLRLIKQNIK